MQASGTNVMARDDTMLGVCQALGEDLGINPFFLRLGFALPLIAFPVATVVAYLALGLVVAAVRLAVRMPRRAARPLHAVAGAAAPAERAACVDREPLAVAA